MDDRSSVASDDVFFTEEEHKILDVKGEPKVTEFMLCITYVNHFINMFLWKYMLCSTFVAFVLGLSNVDIGSLKCKKNIE